MNGDQVQLLYGWNKWGCWVCWGFWGCLGCGLIVIAAASIKNTERKLRWKRKGAGRIDWSTYLDGERNAGGGTLTRRCDFHRRIRGGARPPTRRTWGSAGLPGPAMDSGWDLHSDSGTGPDPAPIGWHFACRLDTALFRYRYTDIDGFWGTWGFGFRAVWVFGGRQTYSGWPNK